MRTMVSLIDFLRKPKGGILISLDAGRSRGRNSLVRELVKRPLETGHAIKFSLTHSHRFILNGLVNANQILGEEVFKLADWIAVGEYVYDKEGGRHQAFYSPVRNVAVFGETVRADERIQVEQSLKYSQAEAKKLWNTASLKEVDQWMLGQEYGKCTPTFLLHPIILFTPGSTIRHFTFPSQPQLREARKSDDTPRTFYI